MLLFLAIVGVVLADRVVGGVVLVLMNNTVVIVSSIL